MDLGVGLDLATACPQDVSALLEETDSLRDQRAWRDAAECYRRYLALRPDDWGIRVQFGHCVKEAGDPEAALGIYREVERRIPSDSDIHLQIGHALKLLGRREEAHHEYLRALELDLESRPAKLEVSALRHHAPPVAARGRAPDARLQLVLDVSDLLAYFRTDRAPTGIQRVQLNVTAHILLAPPHDIVPSVCTFEGSGFWREISGDAFLALWRLSRTGADSADFAWREALDAAFREVSEGFDLPFVPGACLVNLGTSWWISDYFLRVRHVQRRYGVRYVPFVHDGIPILVPEHCPDGLVREFSQWFASLALHADALLCNSRCTEGDARREIAALFPARTLPPSTVVTLDADLRQEFGSLEADSAATDPRLPAPGEPFVFCVGTIESRKDHLLLFHAWLELIRRHGDAAVPRLVCVGKPGWLAEPALALHAGTPEPAARITILHGVEDSVLAGLYARCLFTLYNSHYEGWGLPVTESLSYGRVPLVPRHSALVESGAGGAVFFTPGDRADLIARLEALLFEPGARAGAEARIAEHARLRGWPEIKDQILDALRALPGPEEVPRIPLQTGVPTELRLLREARPSPAVALADAARCGLGWHPLESWGVWTRPGRALLSVPLERGQDVPADAPLRLHLDCVAPPRALRVRLRLLPDGPACDFLAGDGTRFTQVLDLPPGAASIELEIDSGAEGVPLDEPGGRRVGLGLAGLLVCRPDDILARLAFLERRRCTFRPPPSPS